MTEQRTAEYSYFVSVTVVVMVVPQPADQCQDYTTGARSFYPRTLKGTQPDPFWHVGNMQRCPWSIMQAGNLFMYTMHNPVRFTDPTGLFAVSIIPNFNMPEIVIPRINLIPEIRIIPDMTRFLVLASSHDAQDRLDGGGVGKASFGNSRFNPPKPPPPPRATQPPPKPKPQTTQSVPNAATGAKSAFASTSATIGQNAAQSNTRAASANANQPVTTTTSRSLSPTGPPNSTMIRVDAHGKPITIRHYGADGRAAVDIEWGHPHHHGLKPGQSHMHFWNWSKPGHPMHYQPGIPTENFFF